MSANSRFSIALHTLAVVDFLHQQGVKRVPSQQIAKSVNTNPVVIRNLLIALKKAGLIGSTEGKSGGVHLAKSSEKITLHEIYVAVEESAALKINQNAVFKPCPVSRGMKRILPSLFKEVDEAIATTLKRRTLSELVKKL